jgi:hypothetical protein
MSEIGSPIADRSYALAATRGLGKKKHLLIGPLRANKSFTTMCGMWGGADQMPWTVGEMRLDGGGWCQRCERAKKRNA